MIFDNVEKSEDLDQFWPLGGNGKIIVTTQRPDIGFKLTDHEVTVHPFSPDQGRDCILNLLSWPGGVPSDPPSAEALNEELGGLPIGIIHMTALMRASKTSLKTFLRDYRKNKARYHSKDAPGAAGIAPKSKPSIGTNWNISFSALQDQSQSLLGILSLLSPNNIPQSLFKHWDECASRSTRGLLPYCRDADEYDKSARIRGFSNVGPGFLMSKKN